MSGDDETSPASDESMEECRLFRVTGRVQGVFFRASTQTAARDLGVTGHALNRPDGSVEVLACGSVGALDELQAWLHSGPPMAQVSGVEVSRVEYQDIDSFNTR